MTLLTTFLGIIKPEPTDLIDFAAHMHDGWDTIDGKLDGSADNDLDLRSNQWSAPSLAWSFLAGTTDFARRRDLIVNHTIKVDVTRTSSGAVTGTIALALPATSALPNGSCLGICSAYDVSGGFVRSGVVIQATTTSINFAGSDGLTIWNATSPFTWAATDRLSCSFMYEVA